MGRSLILLYSWDAILLNCKRSRSTQPPRLPHRSEGKQADGRDEFGVDVNSNKNFTCTNTITMHQCVCDNYWLDLSKGLDDVAEAGSAVPDEKNISGVTITQSESRL